MLSRRGFLTAGLALGAGLAADAFAIGPKRFRVEKTDVRVQGLHHGLDGFTICQITDVHHGFFVGLDYIGEVVKKANSLLPDIFVLTGDYIDTERKYMAPAIKSLSGLKAPFGVLSILGNHDHFIGKSYSQAVIDSYGIPLLENSNRIIERGGGALCIAGTKDFLEDAPDAKAAFRGADENIARVLLTHHPDYSEHIGDEKIDLIIAGHTHGGQVRLPFSIAPVVPSDFGQKYAGGLVRLGRGTQVYVSRGIGVAMIPVRFNCPPEIALIRLRAQSEAA